MLRLCTGPLPADTPSTRGPTRCARRRRRRTGSAAPCRRSADARGRIHLQAALRVIQGAADPERHQRAGWRAVGAPASAHRVRPACLGRRPGLLQGGLQDVGVSADAVGQPGCGPGAAGCVQRHQRLGFRNMRAALLDRFVADHPGDAPWRARIGSMRRICPPPRR